MMKSTLLVSAALAASLIAGSAAQARTADALIIELPLLVDRWYEIKHPAGPVTSIVQVPEELVEGPELRTMPQIDLDMFKDMPRPNWMEVLQDQPMTYQQVIIAR